MAPFILFGLLAASKREMSQTWNPSAYNENARFVSDLGMSVVNWLDPQPGESVLDLGCGDGALTLKLSNEFGCHVLGVDASKEMVDAALNLGVEAKVMDGQKWELPSESYDAIFSNAALHWMKDDPEKVVEGVYKSLKPGGRFVAELGGAGNICKIETAVRQELEKRGLEVPDTPWYFPSPTQYQNILQEQGFVVERMDHFERPTELPGDVSGWLETFAQPYFAQVTKEETNDIIQQLVVTLKPKLVDDDGIWRADYCRLRFRATKP